MAMDDLALIPLWNRTQFRLVNTKKFANRAMDFHKRTRTSPRSALKSIAPEIASECGANRGPWHRVEGGSFAPALRPSGAA